MFTQRHTESAKTESETQNGEEEIALTHTGHKDMHTYTETGTHTQGQNPKEKKGDDLVALVHGRLFHIRAASGEEEGEQQSSLNTREKQREAAKRREQK